MCNSGIKSVNIVIQSPKIYFFYIVVEIWIWECKINILSLILYRTPIRFWKYTMNFFLQGQQVGFYFIDDHMSNNICIVGMQLFI